MELIPILSVIILVATISTFLLAIGAYILYKVREGKEQAAATGRPQEVSAELVTPAEAAVPRIIKPTRVMPESVTAETKATPGIPKRPVKFEKPSASAPSQSGFTPKPKPYQAYRNQQVAAQERKPATAAGQPAESQKSKAYADSRFLKYTSEGYIPAKEDKEAGALKWR